MSSYPLCDVKRCNSEASVWVSVQGGKPQRLCLECAEKPMKTGLATEHFWDLPIDGPPPVIMTVVTGDGVLHAPATHAPSAPAIVDPVVAPAVTASPKPAAPTPRARPTAVPLGCRIPGCTRPSQARGLCDVDWKRCKKMELPWETSGEAIAAAWAAQQKAKMAAVVSARAGDARAADLGTDPAATAPWQQVITARSPTTGRIVVPSWAANAEAAEQRTAKTSYPTIEAEVRALAGRLSQAWMPESGGVPADDADPTEDLAWWVQYTVDNLPRLRQEREDLAARLAVPTTPPPPAAPAFADVITEEDLELRCEALMDARRLERRIQGLKVFALTGVWP